MSANDEISRIENGCFVTHDHLYAVCARAISANLHPRTQLTGVEFRFPDLPADFAERIERGEVLVDAREFIASHRTVWALIKQFQRTR